MIELLVGFGLGAMALTETGRDVGNKIGGVVADFAKKGISRAKKSAEQSTRTSGDNHHCG
jgi:hypothetical protein